MREIPTQFDAKLLEGLDSVTGLSGIVIESRGGTADSNNYRYPDHAKLLRFVLDRLKENKLSRIQFYVAARPAAPSKKYADNAERLLEIKGKSEFDFLHIDISDLEKELKKGIKASGKKADAKGGNSTKRLLITCAANTIDWNTILLGEAQTANQSPMSDLDEYEYRLLKKRLRQSPFRKEVLKAYKYTCAVTSCKVHAVLEAAHIIPYSGRSSSNINNGLLLRSDIHDLFDLRLIKITSDHTIRVDEKLNDSEYWQYDGRRINLPDQEKDFPVFQ